MRILFSTTDTLMYVYGMNLYAVCIHIFPTSIKKINTTRNDDAPYMALFPLRVLTNSRYDPIRKFNDWWFNIC